MKQFKDVFSDGDAYESDDSEGIWTADISMPHKPESLFRNSMDNIWSSKIECHGESQQDAEGLSDAILAAIKLSIMNSEATSA